MLPRTLECVVKKTGEAQTGWVNTVLCQGQLVVATAPKLKETVTPLLGEGGRVIIDLAEVSYVDSSGLGSLVGLKSAADAAGVKFELRNPSERLQELMRFTHLADLFR